MTGSPSDDPVVERSRLTDQIMNEVYPEFSEQATPEAVESLIRAELSRWDATKVREFVPVFVRRQVRAQLRAGHPPLA
ncbi:MAG TPA: hypothetical protein VEP49_18295 [Acidimicrobiia bacterium]|nr:hypothetical protein [Acidimicrobiia bacterium]